jgi:hypothetical protein
MPLQKIVGNTQLGAYPPYLVLEKITQRLYQPQFHGGRQSTDIMMGFDRLRRTVYRDALYHIGIDRPLSQQFHSLYLLASCWNTSIKSRPMVFRFASGSVLPASSR